MSCSSRGESGCSQSMLPSRTGTDNSTKSQPEAWAGMGQREGAGSQQILTTILGAGTVSSLPGLWGLSFVSAAGTQQDVLVRDQPPRQTGSGCSLQRKVPKGSVPVVGELQGAVGWKPRWECLSSPLVAFVCSSPVSSSFQTTSRMNCIPQVPVLVLKAFPAERDGAQPTLQFRSGCCSPQAAQLHGL